MPSPTTADATGTATATSGGARTTGAPVVIEARGVHKAFRVPEHRVDSLKERATHPFRRIAYREHRALHDVSFEVHRGEFFGITGRNGSGKSTLLKILASIYRADSGRVRTAGRVAPFIELGVGLNPELTARENGVLNGVLMGLTLREARRRLDAVIAFAELEDFVDLKLKNYSSGMMVRFAFAVMVQADADVMLIDEVLAVGDAAFAQKCMDVFRERRRAGKTLVLVTHDMPTVQSLCDRAMLLDDGEVRFLGEPEDTALRYYRMNFAGPVAQARGAASEELPAVEVNARTVHARLRGLDGEPAENVEEGVPIDVDVLLEAARELERPVFLVQVRNEDGVLVFGFDRTLDAVVGDGRRIRLAGRIENRLLPGRYHLDVYVRQGDGPGATVQGLRVLAFVVYGTSARTGIIALEADVEPEVEA
jgi:ABC-type polysaccharide/polyol phosphate transport system ATPase subunit